MTPVPSPLDPPASPASALPSPPTSPRAATARIRIRPVKRPVSLINGPPEVGAEDHTERTTNMSLARIVTTLPDLEGGTIALASPKPKAAASTRRQSSIAYYTPSSPSPWSQQKRSSGTEAHDGECNRREHASKRSSLVLASRSPSTSESTQSLDAREREPLTLVEKHADLLHFIAQKERKCLELRDQLIAHEKELTELKRKWEHIVNYGYDHDPTSSAPLTASLGGVALDGLKEGVRMIAAGFTDLGGASQDLEAANNTTSSQPIFLTHRENNLSNGSSSTKRRGSEHFSRSSASSVHENTRGHASERAPEGSEGEMDTSVVMTSSLSRTGSLNYRVHKRASHSIARDPTTPTSMVAPPSDQNPEPDQVDAGMGMSLIPTRSLGLNAASNSPSTRPVSSGPMSSWMDNMGKKLSELHKNETFSKSQRRASSILAGVSNSITSALTPGPTATTPAPFPMSAHRSPASASKSRSITLEAPQRVRQRLSLPHPDTYSRLDPFSKPTPGWDWLDDEEERGEGDVVGADVRVMTIPERLPPRVSREETSAATAPTAVSSFEDEEWNW